MEEKPFPYLVFIALITLLTFADQKTEFPEFMGKDNELNVPCGAGTLLMGSKPGKGRRVLASTTNQISSQTFSTSSGTSSGCEKNSQIRSESKQRSFISRNYYAIKKDISAGGGEYLYALSNLMGCPNSNEAKFGTITQNNFRYIYGGDSNKSAWILYRLKKSIAQNSTLRSSCSKVWW